MDHTKDLKRVVEGRDQDILQDLWIRWNMDGSHKRSQTSGRSKGSGYTAGSVDQVEHGWITQKISNEW